MKTKKLLTRHTTCAALAALLALLPGCASTGRNFDDSKVAQIKKGETTETDLKTLFGPPESRIVDSEGTTHLNWMYGETRMKGEGFIPIAGVFIGGANSSHKLLTVTLGPDGKVTRFTSSGGGSEMRHMTQDTPPK